MTNRLLMGARDLFMSPPRCPRWLIVALSSLTLTRILGKPATFWLYGAVSIGAWLFAFFLVPETGERPLKRSKRSGDHKPNVEPATPVWSQAYAGDHPRAADPAGHGWVRLRSAENTSRRLDLSLER